MRVFVREGKGNKERYTILSKQSLEMLRIYWSKYRQNKRWGRIFLSEGSNANRVTSDYLFRSIGYRNSKKLSIRPVVTLKSDINLQWNETNNRWEIQ